MKLHSSFCRRSQRRKGSGLGSQNFAGDRDAEEENGVNIQEAKQELIRTVKIYTRKDETGQYKIPFMRQRPVFLLGAPGIGKTAIVEQAARECQVGLVSYTMTHHTRQSAIGLPEIREKTYQGRGVYGDRLHDERDCRVRL